jgi:hypothetical protein
VDCPGPVRVSLLLARGPASADETHLEKIPSLDAVASEGFFFAGGRFKRYGNFHGSLLFWAQLIFQVLGLVNCRFEQQHSDSSLYLAVVIVAKAV